MRLQHTSGYYMPTGMYFKVCDFESHGVEERKGKTLSLFFSGYASYGHRTAATVQQLCRPKSSPREWRRGL